MTFPERKAAEIERQRAKAALEATLEDKARAERADERITAHGRLRRFHEAVARFMEGMG